MNIKRIVSGATIAATFFFAAALSAVAVPINSLDTKGAFQFSNTGGTFGSGILSGDISFSTDRGAIPDFGQYTVRSQFATRTATSITSSVGSKTNQLDAASAAAAIDAAVAAFDRGVATSGTVMDLADGGAFSLSIDPITRSANGFQGDFEFAFEVLSQGDLDALAAAATALLDPLGLGFIPAGVTIDDLTGTGSFALTSSTDVEALAQIAPVPVPAGGLLLLTGLGAFAFGRRLRKTA